jgi:hypothetical protein
MASPNFALGSLESHHVYWQAEDLFDDDWQRI